jgi:hypothetical protein
MEFALTKASPPNGGVLPFFEKAAATRWQFKLGGNTMTDVQAKPYPRFCGECGQESVAPQRISYNAKIKHDGQFYQFLIEALPIDQCESCGEQWFTLDTDEALQAGLRKHLGLLSPD